MGAELHSAVASRLRLLDQRYTSNRRSLVDALTRSGRPLTPAELAAGDNGAVSSLYRNLGVLEEAGVLRRVASTDGQARYELAEELTEHHHHLVCRRCGRVEDVDAPGPLEKAVARELEQVATASGFRPEEHRLDVVGVCADCH
jgi:Fur family transcriptional regulator, ferric uptake regulator